MQSATSRRVHKAAETHNQMLESISTGAELQGQARDQSDRRKYQSNIPVFWRTKSFASQHSLNIANLSVLVAIQASKKMGRVQRTSIHLRQQLSHLDVQTSRVFAQEQFGVSAFELVHPERGCGGCSPSHLIPGL